MYALRSKILGRSSVQRLLQAAASKSTAAAEPFLNGSSSTYVEEMYESWKAEPTSVHKSWQIFFSRSESGAAPGEAHVSAPNLPVYPIFAPSHPHVTSPVGDSSDPSTISTRAAQNMINKHHNFQRLLRSYQSSGHHIAQLDPLGIGPADLDATHPETLKLEHYNFTKQDMDQYFQLPRYTYLGGEENELTLRETVNRLERIYCSSIGTEFMHIMDPAAREYIRKWIEKPGISDMTNEEKRILLARLVRSTRFEEFLAKKWPSEKRFGLEGCEVLIPAMKQIIDIASSRGVDNFVIGMPHRGRLNVLANVCRKELAKLFSQFNPDMSPEDEGSGDVKYHLGMYHRRINHLTNKEVELSVVANPSHLEAVNPVVCGKVRATQFFGDDDERKKTMAILLHGDAAYAGQGIVYETMHLSDLPSYTTGGTIHIVVNNQIGFTTDPRFSRSSPYCTDVAKVVNAPILHVNADDPEAVMHVCNIAANWRADWGKDVVLDLVCYRRNGHNEADEPSFTQPLMVKRIKETPTVLSKYSSQLLSEETVTQEDIDDEIATFDKILNDAYQNSQGITKMKLTDWLDSPWNNFFKCDENKVPILVPTPSTGANDSVLKIIAEKFSEDPPITVHPGIKRILKGRRKMVAEKQADWALGEALAFGSLLMEGYHVRLSGQDVERGTFSHRHHVLHDQETDGKTYNPLQKLSSSQQKYSVSNSSLSEFGVLGFELGFSQHNPNSLVIWEAQFGDFFNTAQPIVDQFISSGQDKWYRQSALVMLLPHGMEGMGPEHSSARLERFLQMCNDDDDSAYDGVSEDQQLWDCNWQIVNITNPANMFHALRRQMYMNFRKPLVVFTPKSLLRHPLARSSFSEMTTGTSFKPVIPESKDISKCKKLLLCSGRVYYDLFEERSKLGLEDQVAITRIEQLHPFPHTRIEEEIKRYPEGVQICWVQEEHKNAGAWAYISPRVQKHVQAGSNFTYLGRDPAASAATGNKKVHKTELHKFMVDSFNIP